ncbi:PE/PPE C-terminal domain-containing protein, partial [Mycobacterium ulcerans]
PHPQPWAARGQSVPGLGNASALGKLSVPPSWPGSGLDVPPSVSAGGPLASDIVNPPEASAPGSLLGGMPLAGGPGGAAAGAGPRYGFRVTVMARPPFAG